MSKNTTLFDFAEVKQDLDKLAKPKAIKNARPKAKRKKKYHVRPCKWCGQPIKLGKQIEHWEEHHMAELKKLSVNGYKIPGRGK